MVHRAPQYGAQAPAAPNSCFLKTHLKNCQEFTLCIFQAKSGSSQTHLESHTYAIQVLIAIKINFSRGGTVPENKKFSLTQYGYH